jgi:hypothetical protein
VSARLPEQSPFTSGHTDPQIRARLEELARPLEDADVPTELIDLVKGRAKASLTEQLVRELPGRLGLTGRQSVITTAIVVLLGIVVVVLVGGYKLGETAHADASAFHAAQLRQADDQGKSLNEHLGKLDVGQAAQTEVLRSIREDLRDRRKR